MSWKLRWSPLVATTPHIMHSIAACNGPLGIIYRATRICLSQIVPAIALTTIRQLAFVYSHYSPPTTHNSLVVRFIITAFYSFRFVSKFVPVRTYVCMYKLYVCMNTRSLWIIGTVRMRALWFSGLHRIDILSCIIEIYVRIWDEVQKF